MFLQLIVGSVGGAVGMFVIAAYIKIADPANHPTTDLPKGGIMGMLALPWVHMTVPNSSTFRTMVFFYIWTIFYAVSWNVSLVVAPSIEGLRSRLLTLLSRRAVLQRTPWVVCSEASPGSVCVVTQMPAAASNWL